MNKILTIIKREFMTKFFTKGFLIGTLLSPFIMLGLIFFPALLGDIDQERTNHFHFVDQSGTLASQMNTLFNDTLSDGSPEFQLTEISPATFASDRQRLETALEEDAMDAILVIPENVLSNGKIDFLATSVGGLSVLGKMEGRFQEAINKIRLQDAGLDPDNVEKLTANVDINTLKVGGGEQSEDAFDQQMIMAVVFLFFLYMSSILYGNSVMRGVLEEKTSRIIEVLLSSSNSFQLMMGKIFGVGSLGLAQYLVWMVVGGLGFFIAGSTAPSLLNNISVEPIVFLYFILFYMIGFFQYSSLYAAAGAMSNTQEDAQGLSTPVTFLIIIPFLLSLTLGMQNPDGTISTILSILPFFAPMVMFVRMALVDPPMIEIVLSLVVNVAAIIFFIWLCAKIYRVGVLMYGKRPTVPEMIKWLRYR